MDITTRYHGKAGHADDAKVSREELPYQAFVTDLNGNVNEGKMRFSYRNMTMHEIECDKYVLEECEIAKDNDREQE